MRIEGLRELQDQIVALGEATGGKILRNAARSAMLPAEKAAKLAVPRGSRPHWLYKNGKRNRLVGPGFASRNIKRKVRRGGGKHNVVVKLAPSKEARYVMLQEIGTKHISKRPWLTVSFNLTKHIVLDRFKDQMRKGILKAAR